MTEPTTTSLTLTTSLIAAKLKSLIPVLFAAIAFGQAQYLDFVNEFVPSSSYLHETMQTFVPWNKNWQPFNWLTSQLGQGNDSSLDLDSSSLLSNVSSLDYWQNLGSDYLSSATDSVSGYVSQNYPEVSNTGKQASSALQQSWEYLKNQRNN